MNAYFISGLGADKQMFRRIELPEEFNIVYLEWINPLKGESFEHYAKRLAQGIDQSTDFILIGLSLGGLISVEMNKFLRPTFTILISSVVNKQALPFWFVVAGRLHVPKITPSYFYHHNNFFTNWLFGAHSKEDKQLLKSVMRNASPGFVHWAIPRILNWNNKLIPERMLHLHGTKDVILPFRRIKNAIGVEGGTHFMVFNRAKEINKILADKLSAI
ncbi:alpha/beta fold hydrolase [Arachidicoccus soli]|uniref:Alpha/beta hydrolase n=1 Tax=Arachidicoccus soli TaxID=2341117 RepID=A0A386HR37_9BACT|nr:alpha/beta hydrolase [Arachidicoccus soli]AYD48119.1 alpha/beta hydrolase [Arachidicoccus soli]